MATEKVTPMVLKVDLQCPCCYKKIKKTLCKFPQIRDQLYDEKANKVMITVVCCSPEKIRDKLCCKGGKAIKSIEILEEPKKPEKKPDGGAPPPAAAKPKGDAGPPPPSKPKGDGGAPPPAKPKGDGGPPPPAAAKPKGDGGAPPPAKPKGDGGAEKPKGGDGGAPPTEKPKGGDGGAPPAAKPKGDGGPPPASKPKGDGGPPPPVKILEPAAAMQMMGPGPALVQGVPSVFPYMGPSHDAYSAGPYYHGYGFPPPPPQPSYEGYYGHGQPGYGYGYVNRSDNYFSDENPQTCSIM